MTTESNPLDRTGTTTLRLNLGGTILAVDVPRKPFIMGDCVTVSKKIYDKLLGNKQFLLLRMLETPTNKYQMTQSIVYFKDKLPSGSKCNSHVIVLYNGNIIDVIKFEIPNNINCYELSKLKREYSLKLSKIILTNISKTKKLPNINKSLIWGDIVMTRKK